MAGRLPGKMQRAVTALATRRVRIDCDLIPYTFERVPLRKLWNWMRVEVSIPYHPERPWGLPTHLQVEPSALCNLKCALCPVTEGLSRPAGNMDPSLFQRLIDEIGKYVFLILLWDWGEPFLNPDIYDMIAYARHKGIKTVSSTNGHPFAKAENADRLIRSGLDSLIVAADGTTQESYERFRQGGRLESVLQGIRTIVERKRALGSLTPLLNLRFIVMRQNEHELPQLRALAASLGVDALTLKTLNPYCDSGTADPEYHYQFVPQNPVYRRFVYRGDSFERIRVKHNRCKHLWNNPAIHWDGVVCPCSFDWGNRYPLGDLRQRSFVDIWNGPHYRALRRKFRQGWEDLGMCRECSYAYEGGACSTDAVAEALFFGEQGRLVAEVKRKR